MASRLIFYLLFLYGFEGSLGVRPDSLEPPSLVPGGSENRSDDDVLAVNHRGIIHRDHTVVEARSLNASGTRATQPPATHQYRVQTAESLPAPGTGGLLQLLQGGHHFKPTAPTASLKPNDVLIFYGLVYTIGLGVYLCFRYLEAVKVNFSRILRQVAVVYWRWSRLAPMAASCCLFVIADLLAQAAGTAPDRGGICWMIALLFTSAAYNASWHHYFYSWLDSKVDEGEGVRGRVKQVAMMVGLHLVMYLPVAVPFFLILVDFLNRTFNDAVVNCSTSALASIPHNIGESTALAAEQLASSYGWSFIFWPASSVINFSLVQSWAPGFKSTWDAIMVVLWNSYMLIMSGSSDPVAVGPMLADRDALTPELKKQAPSIDCQKYSAVVIAYDIVDTCFITTKITVEYTYYFIHWSLLTSKTESYRFGCYVKRHIWEFWCVICYITRQLYMLTWTLISYFCTIVWRLLMIPFKMFDAVKWYIGLFFVPRFWDYDSCPCMTANFDKSWTQPGVIYTGTLLGVK